MEPESLGLEENQSEVQDLDITGQIREIAHVLPLEEIANLAAAEGQPAETLMNVVALIAKRFDTEVCSAYLLEPDRANLVLAATVGLRRECIGNLRMAINEGLAGLVAEQVHPVAVEQVTESSALQVLSRGRRRCLPVVPRSSTYRPRGSAGRSGSANRGASDFRRRRDSDAGPGGGPGGAGGERSAHAGSLHRSCAGAALGTGSQLVVELGPRCRQHIPRS